MVRWYHGVNGIDENEGPKTKITVSCDIATINHNVSPSAYREKASVGGGWIMATPTQLSMVNDV